MGFLEIHKRVQTAKVESIFLFTVSCQWGLTAGQGIHRVKPSLLFFWLHTQTPLLTFYRQSSTCSLVYIFIFSAPASRFKTGSSCIRGRTNEQSGSPEFITLQAQVPQVLCFPTETLKYYFVHFSFLQTQPQKSEVEVEPRVHLQLMYSEHFYELFVGKKTRHFSFSFSFYMLRVRASYYLWFPFKYAVIC